MALWRQRKQVRVIDGSVLAWLLVTVTNLHRNRVRGLRRYRAMLASLPRSRDAHRVDRLRGFHPYAGAAALGISPGAARTRLHRARLDAEQVADLAPSSLEQPR
jgi:DNA-directed RNA polymerase specialized sigma24 family protein